MVDYINLPLNAARYLQITKCIQIEHISLYVEMQVCVMSHRSHPKTFFLVFCKKFHIEERNSGSLSIIKKFEECKDVFL